MPKKKQKYQNLIYVSFEEDSEGEVYMTACFDPAEQADLGEENEVGIYQFVRTAKVRTKIEVV